MTAADGTGAPLNGEVAVTATRIGRMSWEVAVAHNGLLLHRDTGNPANAKVRQRIVRRCTELAPSLKGHEGELEERILLAVPSTTEPAAAPRTEREVTPSALRFTDLGNARALAEQHGTDCIHVHGRGWFTWDGRRWAEDCTGEVTRRAKLLVGDMLRESAANPNDPTMRELARHALRSATRERIGAMVTLAASEERLAFRPSDLDANPHLLTVKNGTLDLRSGTLLAHDRAHLITKLAPAVYDPEAQAPLWHAMLERILPDAEVRSWLKEMIGYGATGLVLDHVVPILWGNGSNGKSTFIGAVQSVLGDYAKAVPAELLMASRGDRHPTERTELEGIRLAVAAETEEGGRLNEPVIKGLSGGDVISARKCGRDFYTFRPTHKLVLLTNHKPIVRGTDHGVWRRLRLLPFTVAIPKAEEDAALPSKLEKEASGILKWIVEGARRFLDRGRLPECAAVTTATEGYRESQDVLGRWIAEKCTITPAASCKSSILYASYKAHVEANGERLLSANAFATALEERGFEKVKASNVFWQGIDLVPDSREDRRYGV
ncbi:MAG: hypothetical protein IT458_20615 [Planctomycetes bacterium]|nr:hypothetical protein [Planctomycetota bacterium]